MGLTNSSTGRSILEKELRIDKLKSTDKIIALGGNPNVGKSTIFNNLTGLNQHTGNWPGKTVTNAHGEYFYKDTKFILVDIPGTYSLMSNSVEEEVARDFICFGNPDTTVIVLDATCLERNLNLALQTLEITSNVVVCVNLMDEAKRKGISINLKKLSKELGVPVIGTSAVNKKSLDELIDTIYNVTSNNNICTPINIIYENQIEKSISEVEEIIKLKFRGNLPPRWLALKLIDGNESLLASIKKYLNFNLTEEDELMKKVYEVRTFLNDEGITSEVLRDKIVSELVKTSEKISNKVLTFENRSFSNIDRKIDKYLTSKKFGIPIMLLLLAIIFWITISGANIPSELLAKGLFEIQNKLTDFLNWLGTPLWVHSLLIDGIYKTLAWVISVMLPPMAIFFPLFTLLEDLGYLPRIAFNLDNYFKKACACGKQALTMCMGFGCNAAGIVGCRIIDSPRERLIAIITNNFVPCNGRFPTLIAIISMFFTGIIVGPFKSVVSTLILTGVIVLGVLMTLIISKILSKTILKGIPSTFTLELPPYRKPQIGKIIIRSIFDRTLFVLGRAMIVAAPAGLVIWLMSNIHIDNLSILTHCANFLNPFATLIGLDGYILMAFILGFPANEIVIPIIIMSYMSKGSLVELDSLEQLKNLLVSNGWTWLTAVCVMLFSLMHWPCATTCLTIRKETQSLKWTLISFLVPTITGIVICFSLTTIVRLLNLI
ncbi:ferrous iron transport protein B [Clostridium cavendishii DSM 21758]|uniref:Ferrous iron transport protein B n=1 Tax=Clostridium cavendishii DSM 21758 TaxID=1121302 RepID=A0A1M6DEI3_9CLOT|nr:ferrous iron transport protein B [Clostridium cavendishii]SHI71666.1 ferrous iron transport protein B [Clostridium cavendishii DSM 21758]